MKILGRLTIPVALAFTALFTVSCSHDPNVLKQKYFASGTAYVPVSYTHLTLPTICSV